MKIDFSDYSPAPRFDAIPYTTIRIEESASKDGPWTVIDTFALNPVDADPAHPASRNFTTVLGTLVNGWYKVSFIDAANNILPTEPIQNVDLLDAEYLPTLRQVGLTTIGRTVDTLGNKLGTFTQATTPTDDQVRELIALAGEDIRNLIGGTIPSDLRLKAQRVIALRTAMMIEVSFYGSEVAAERSPYVQLKDMYSELWPQLRDAVAAEEAGGSVEDELKNDKSPQWGFDAPVLAADGRYGWMNRRM